MEDLSLALEGEFYEVENSSNEIGLIVTSDSSHTVEVLSDQQITVESPSNLIIVGDKEFYRGETGDAGPEGMAGPAGASLYTWTKYADDIFGAGLSSSPTNKSYVGFAYNKEVALASLNPADYSWVLLKGVAGKTGADGIRGPVGLPGPIGLTGATGADGIAGNTGLRGLDGIRGASGIPGPAGTSADIAEILPIITDKVNQSSGSFQQTVNELQAQMDAAIDYALNAIDVDYTSVVNSLEQVRVDLMGQMELVTTQNGANTTAIGELTVTINNGLEAVIQQIQYMETNVNQNFASKTELTQVITTEIAARIESINSALAVVANNYASLQQLSEVSSNLTESSVKIQTNLVAIHNSNLDLSKSDLQSLLTQYGLFKSQLGKLEQGISIARVSRTSSASASAVEAIAQDVLQLDTAIGGISSSIVEINFALSNPAGSVATNLQQLRASINSNELYALAQDIQEVRVNADGSASSLAGIRASIGASGGTPEQQQSAAELILSTIKTQAGEAYSRAYLGVTSYDQGQAISTGLVIDGATRSLNFQGEAISFSNTAGVKKIYYDSADNTWVIAAKVVLNDGTVLDAASDVVGPAGPQGIPGPSGADGAATYTWIKYADTAVGGGISNDPTNKLYIGFAYNKSSPVESNVASDYGWALIRGEKGDIGIPGAPGADGQTTFTWIKYADNADGTGLYDTPTANTLYIGVAVNKASAAESTVKTDYVWSKFRGDTGATGPQGIPGSTGAAGARGPGFFGAIYSYIAATAEEITSRFTALTGFVPVVGDIFVQTLTSRLSSSGKKFDGTSWVDPALMINGDLIVSGSIGATHIAATAINSTHISAGAIKTDNLDTNAVTAEKLNVQSVFAQTISLPDSGVIRAGTTDYAEMGGSSYFTARSDNLTIFKIAKDGNHFIDGRFITNTLPHEAFDDSVIPFIRSQLSLGTPSAGGSSSINGTLGGYGVMLTTTETIASSGVGEPSSIVVGYGGIEVSRQMSTIPNAPPKITLQVQRVTNGGSPENVGPLKEFIGEFRRTASGSPATYEFSVPSFRVLETDSAPGAGNLQYQVVIFLISPTYLGDDLGTVTLAASQRAAGAVSGTITWGNLIGKPTTVAGFGLTDALPLYGGTMTGPINFNAGAVQTSENLNFQMSGVTIWRHGREADGDYRMWYYNNSGSYLGSFSFSRAGVITAPVFSGYLSGNAATATTAGSIAGFNNPSATNVASTIAYRDGAGDVQTRLFRSDYPAEGYFPAGSALAFRANNTSDNYIRFCSDPAAIRNWLGVVDLVNPQYIAGQKTFGGRIVANDWIDPGASGIYYGSTNTYWYSTKAGSFTVRGDTSASQIEFQTNGGASRGYIYADYQENIGFLKGSSGAWKFKVDQLGNLTLNESIKVTLYPDSVGFTNSTGGSARGLRAGALLLSSDFSDYGAVPDWGIYAVGSIVSATGFTGNGSGLTNLNASNIALGTLSDARLPGIFSPKQVSKTINPIGANDHHMELYSPDAGGGGDIALRFHQGGRWYYSIRASSAGFRFTAGSSNDLTDITAGKYMLGDSGSHIHSGGADGAARITTTSGYLDIGAQNAQYMHFFTDRPAFYFDKLVDINGGVRVYGTNEGIDASGHYGNGSRLTAVKATTFTTDSNNYKGVTDNAVAGMLMWKNYGNGHVIFDASSGVSPSGTAVNNTNPAQPWSGSYPTLMGWNGGITFGVRVDSSRYSDLATNSNALGGFSPSNYLRGGQIILSRDANTQPNMDANFTYAVNAPFSGPLIKMGGVGYELQLNAPYSAGDKIAFRTYNGDGPGWGYWREMATYDPSTTYLFVPSWIRAAANCGLYWDAGNHLEAGTSGTQRIRNGLGYVDIGPQNSAYCHIQTSMPNFYMDKSVYVDGSLDIYGSGTGTRLNGAGLAWTVPGVSLYSNGSAGIVVNGPTSATSIVLQTSGTTRGYVYADAANAIGFLDQNGAWKLRVDSAGMLHVADGTSTSDRRVKRNIEPIQNALAKVKTLTGNTYDQIEMGIRRAGPIAQEIQLVLPEAVSADEHGKLAVSQMGLIALLIESVKELSAEVDTLKRRLH